MERLIDLYNQYYDKLIIWFNGLSYLGQITALAVGFFVTCMIIGFFIMQKMAR